MRFYLSKADEAGHESDRQRVMMQIVQELCKRPALNRTCFDMPTIYIPKFGKPSRCVNQIEEVCKDIEKTINQTIQNTLNSLEKDCDRIGQLVDEAIHRDNVASSANMRAYLIGGFLYLLTLSLPLALVLLIFTDRFFIDILGQTGADVLKLYLTPVRTLWSGVPDDYQQYVAVFLAVVVLLLLIAAKVFSRTTPTLTRKQKRQLLDKQEYVTNVVKTKKKTLYSQYLQQTVSDHDL
jgi:ABC-type multidrug transport system fused ATPase/permease subunit